MLCRSFPSFEKSFQHTTLTSCIGQPSPSSDRNPPCIRYNKQSPNLSLSCVFPCVSFIYLHDLSDLGEARKFACHRNLPVRSRLLRMTSESEVILDLETLAVAAQPCASAPFPQLTAVRPVTSAIRECRLLALPNHVSSEP
jgi:hypothetical protein